MKEQAFHGYVLRFYPTKAQENILAKTLGCCRFVWNASLSYLNERYDNHGLRYSKKAMDQYLLDLKRRYPWLYEANANCLVQTQRDLDKAYRRFFEKSALKAKTASGKRKPRKPRKDGRPQFYPRFKHRTAEGSCRFQLDYRNGREHIFEPMGVIELTKELRIRPVWSQVPTTRPKMVTVLRNAAGEWYVSFTCAEEGAKHGGLRALAAKPGVATPSRALEYRVLGRFLEPKKMDRAEIYGLLRSGIFPTLVGAGEAFRTIGPRGERILPKGFTRLLKAAQAERRTLNNTRAPRIARTGDREVDDILNAIHAEVMETGRLETKYTFSLDLLERIVKSPALASMDLGLIDVVTLQDGRKFPGVTKQLKALLKYERRIASMQRTSQRKRAHRKRGAPPSKRYAKHQEKLARVHLRAANTREDLHQKLSDRLLAPGVVLACLESLFVAGLIRNPNLAKHIQNMALGLLKRLITDKAQARRIALLSCGRFDPSSKTCHQCGHYHASLTLGEREWTCPSCQATLDRDINAAINIFIYATGGQPGVYIERGALRICAVRPGDGLEKPAPDDRESGGGSVQTAGVQRPRLSGGKQGC